MELTAWLTLAGICALGAASPGPSLGVVLANTVSGGRGAGVATALGHGIGVGIYAALAVAGMAMVLTTSPRLFIGLQIAGAAFLAWLGMGALRSTGASGPHAGTGRGFSEGFLIAFLNPKIAAFFLALFASLVDPSATSAEKAGMGLMAGAIDATWYALVALVLSGTGLGPWLQSRGRLFDRVMGVSLLAVAIALVVRLALGADS